MFWRKNKPIILHCYTHRADVYNYFPLEKASKFIPNWFKKLPTPSFLGLHENGEEKSVSNLKECVGFINYFSKGFILPLWSDLFIALGKKGTLDYRWQFSDSQSVAEAHGSSSTGGAFLEEDYQHLKLNSPWMLRCDEHLEFLALEPEWYFEKLDGVHVLNGVIEFKINPGTNINMYLKRLTEEKHILIESGTPLYHFVPLTERNVVLKTHLVSETEFNNIHDGACRTSFTRTFWKKRKIRQKNCPYSFKVEK
jgi:hypothetical protein